MNLFEECVVTEMVYEKDKNGFPCGDSKQGKSYAARFVTWRFCASLSAVIVILDDGSLKTCMLCDVSFPNHKIDRSPIEPRMPLTVPYEP